MSTTVRPSVRPVLLSPTANQPADAAMTTFSWYATASENTRLQISADRGFAAPMLDVPVAGLDQLTLEKALPAGQTYFWRVGQDGAWSASGAFESATDDQVQRWTQTRAEAFVPAPQTASAPQHEQVGAFPDVLPASLGSGTTSPREILVWTLPIAISLLIIAYLFVRTLY